MFSQDKILLFGDSITEFSCDQSLGFGLAPALQNLYIRKLDVLVRGYSGYTTQSSKHLIGPILEAEMQPHSKVVLAVVFYGSNDACVPGSPQHVDIDQYEENIRYIATELLKRKIKVVLVTPTLVDETRVLDPDEPNYRTLANFYAYGRRVIKVAESLDVAYVDLFTTFALTVKDSLDAPLPGSKGGPSIEHLLPDTLHFSGEAYKLYYKALVKAINTRYPELNADELPTTLLGWRELDPDLTKSPLEQ